MSRYKLLFQNLSLMQEGCFVPFVMIGDPSINTSIQIIETLINNGADAIELGIPFSDPIADGPTIQQSHLRALSKKNTFIQYFQVLAQLRKKYINIPIGILIYANLIYNQGIENFYLQCVNSGLDSVLIADIPIEESNIFYKQANEYNIDSIFICPPDADNLLLDKIIKYAKGYVYLLSRPGVTGIENSNMSLNKNVLEKLKEDCSVPFLQGFGISNSIQIKQILKTGASGVICGSVIINIIEKFLHQEEKMILEVKKISTILKKATKQIYL